MSGQIVKERIEQSGISLSEVARRLSITPQSLQERLSVKDIKIGALYEIAKAIGKDLSYFLEDYSKELQESFTQDDIDEYDPKKEQNPKKDKKQSSNSVLVDMRLLLQAKDEIINAQKKTIILYEHMLAGLNKG